MTSFTTTIIWFYLGAFVLLGGLLSNLLTLGPRSLFYTTNLPNFWGFACLLVATLLQTHQAAKAWWFGAILSGYFAVIAIFALPQPLIRLLSGSLSLSTLQPFARLIFGSIALVLLYKQSVMAACNIQLKSTAHKNLICITVTGFSIGLFGARTIFYWFSFWLTTASARVSFIEYILNLFTFFNVPFFVSLFFFVSGKYLLRGKQWAYYFTLTVWNIIAAWSLVSAVKMIVNISRYGLASTFLSPDSVAGIISGGLFVMWLVRQETRQFFNLPTSTKNAIIKLSAALFLVAAVTTSFLVFS
ncbi:MAG: hypothetical protein AAF267_20380 [Deinococcota bacterium]